ncbi:hypothetical protein LWC33_29435 [Pseudonocardia sp. RS11V-5]|uniref:hypothetical protein n=1 Tax=Pseudonocardia terrae TaxID=2905831 RepID=UPI001E2AED9C|nr:hypothetical protein [Pseudonocardia terrae]MCE3555555.1 hypothetical protein [Pseudonocardia terrae]
MSSLARRTLATTATVAGVAALGAAFAGQAFAADMPSLPATPELPTGAAALPEAPALEAPSLDSAPQLPTDFSSFSVPGVANLETPNVTVDSSGNSSTAGELPAASHEAAHDAPALPALPGAVQSHLPNTGGELATPQATLPLAAPQLPAAPELPAAPQLPSLPSTADQNLDTQDSALPTSGLAAPSAGDVAQQIAALAG